MEQFPQELITSVLSYIQTHYGSEGRISSYSTISRNWQYAVERITFHSLSIPSNELQKCHDALRPAQKHRSSLIKEISLAILLPDYADEDALEEESEEDEEANAQAFAEAVRGLFEVIQAVNAPEEGLKVRFSNLWAHNDDMFAKKWDRKRFPEKYSERDYFQRYNRNLVVLRSPEDLPVVSGVSTFHVSDCFPRHFDPAALVDIALKFEKLVEFRIENSDKRMVKKDFRIDYRQDLGESLLQLRDSGLQKLVIKTETQEQMNEKAKIDFFRLTPGFDKLNQALHQVSQHLTVLHLLDSHMIPPEFFWPSDDESAMPSWPHLKELVVQFDPRTPDGDWYFMRDPDAPVHPDFLDDQRIVIDPAEDGDGEQPEPPAHKNSADKKKKKSTDDEDGEDDDDDEDSDSDASSFNAWSSSDGSDNDGFRDLTIRQFRGRPKRLTLNPLLLAAARAVRHMPRLETFELSTERDDDLYDEESSRVTTRQFCLKYLAKGRGKVEGPVLVWDVPDWRPDEDVEKGWREAIGADGVVCFENGGV